jgi:hypothetical protein
VVQYLIDSSRATRAYVPRYHYLTSKSLDSRRQTNNLTTESMADRTHSYHDSDFARNSRSQSPHRHHHRSHRIRSPQRHHKRRRSPESAAKELPYNSRLLAKHDYVVFRPMFALYLEIQKGKVIDDLNEVEVKGRWKSFIGKW